MGNHAILGASGAHRWMKCPGSIQLMLKVPRKLQAGSSKYALEGNAAHALCEMCLLHDKDAKFWEGSLIRLTTEGDLIDVLKPENPADSEPWVIEDPLHHWPVTDEMVDAVQVFLDAVRNDAAEQAGADTEVHCEASYSLEPILGRDDMFGTTDAAITQPFGLLRVYDFKYGKGVVVEVEENEQMMFYGLGAIGKFASDDFAEVELVIVQPRAFHPDGSVRRWRTTITHMMDFADILGAAAVATEDPKAPRTPGDHCKFCPVKAHCQEFKDNLTQVTSISFDAPVVLPASVEDYLPDPGDPVAVAKALAVVPLMDDYIKAVEGLAQRLAEQGTKVPGNKLVRKQTQRRWADKAAVERRLRRREGVTVKDIFKPRVLQSPAQLEKIEAIGKTWVARHATKPEGGLVLVPESDARAEVVMIPDVFPDPDEKALKSGEAPAVDAPTVWDD